jgi:hypothetical protein
MVSGVTTLERSGFQGVRIQSWEMFSLPAQRYTYPEAPALVGQGSIVYFEYGVPNSCGVVFRE